MNFQPIAIIGRACIVPGAETPDALWEQVVQKKNGLTTAERAHWGVNPDTLLTVDPYHTIDRVWTRVVGVVSDFYPLFRYDDFALDANFIRKLDLLHHLLLHCGREALHDANITYGTAVNAGLIVGNLSYPTTRLSQYTESVWLTKQAPETIGFTKYNDLLRNAPHPINRFMSGYPIQLAARALNLNGLSFALDSACASSLYAIKLACDALHDDRADVMLAGGVNATDSLFLSMGFTALRALSKTGKSRPLHKEADGIIPAQGCGMLVLKRLSDAIQHQDNIYGVIRGIGLSNDGKSNGFLAPSEAGQEAAMRQAYEQAGVSPADVSWIECHATGTPVGDGAEIRSMMPLFGKHSPVISALKANIGHTITASSVVGLINLLSGIVKKQLPPISEAADEPMELIKESGFQLLKEAQAWQAPNNRFVAALNSFGFGGNNAHILVEAFDAKTKARFCSDDKKRATVPSEPLVIVGLHVLNGTARHTHEWMESLYKKQSLIRPFASHSSGSYIESIALDPTKIPFPPASLHQALGQQLAILYSTEALLEQIKWANPERTAVLIGMQCSPEISKRSLVWRLEQLLPGITEPLARHVRSSVFPEMDSCAVLGGMPNIIANRLNAMFDFKAPSFSVSAEEVSGTVAMTIAMRELKRHAIDMALVGAADLSCEAVHQAAVMKTLESHAAVPGDAAVLLLLQREADAIKEGRTVLAYLSETPQQERVDFTLANNTNQLSQYVGHAHAAAGLLHVAAATLACEQGYFPDCAETIRTAAVHLYSFEHYIHSFYLASQKGAK